MLSLDAIALQRRRIRRTPGLMRWQRLFHDWNRVVPEPGRAPVRPGTMNHEASKLINRISDAKAEKLLTEFEAPPPLA